MSVIPVKHYDIEEKFHKMLGIKGEDILNREKPCSTCKYENSFMCDHHTTGLLGCLPLFCERERSYGHVTSIIFNHCGKEGRHWKSRYDN